MKPLKQFIKEFILSNTINYTITKLNISCQFTAFCSIFTMLRQYAKVIGTEWDAYTGSCRGPSRGLQIEREAQGDYCELMITQESYQKEHRGRKQACLTIKLNIKENIKERDMHQVMRQKKNVTTPIDLSKHHDNPSLTSQGQTRFCPI